MDCYPPSTDEAAQRTLLGASERGVGSATTRSEWLSLLDRREAGSLKDPYGC